MICKALIKPQRKATVPDKKKFEAKLPMAIPTVADLIVSLAALIASDSAPFV
jgi:retron-type reverse transcriptase